MRLTDFPFIASFFEPQSGIFSRYVIETFTNFEEYFTKFHSNAHE